MKERKVIRKGLVFKSSIVLFIALFACVVLSSAVAQGPETRDSEIGTGESAAELEMGSYIGQDEGTAPAYVTGNAEFFSASKFFISGAALGNMMLVFIVILLVAVFIATFVYFKADKRKKLKKFVRFYIGIALIFVVFAAMPMNVSADFAGGDGSVGNPYQISTVEQLQDMGNNLAAHYILVNDIDASATSSWNSGAGFAPIGNSATNSFTGSFDGDGYSISDLYINRTTGLTGLFGFVHGGTIQNVALTNVDISGGSETGGLVGRHRESSEISNCSVTGTISGLNEVGGLVGRNVITSTISGCSATCTVNGNNQVGGLVGRNGNSTISGCSAACDVDGNWYYVGGLVGVNINSATISNSNATCSVDGDWQVGGLVGRNYEATISGSSANCVVTCSPYECTGGLVGYNYQSSITNCNAAGTVTGVNWVGGLVGQNYEATNTDCSATGDISGNNYIGGLAGYNVYSQITDSSASGIVDGQWQVGGLVGRNYDSTISGSSASGSLSGYGIVGGLVGGLAYYSTILDSDSTCNAEGMQQVGGLVGATWGDFAEPYLERNQILNCSATGNASGIGDGWIGGLIGEMYYTELSNSHASGNAQGHQQVGGLVGRCDDASIITDCYATGNVSASVSASSREVERFGGLIGTMSEQSILEDSYATGNVTTEPDPNDPEFAILVGGLCGYTGWNLAENGPYGEVTNCYATGNVIGGEYVGGLTGQIGRRTAISNCYATGSASGTWNVGGLSGDTTGLSMISNSYAIGDVSGTRDLGGLTGRLENDSEMNNCYATGNITATYIEFGGTEEPSNVGGLVGECSFEEGWGGNAISYCYSAGHISVSYSVEPPMTVGGLVGAKDTETTISSSYWDTNTSGQSTSAGGTGKTTAEMKQQTTFVGWDFVNTWRIQENTTYPYLYWQIQDPEDATQDLILVVNAMDLPDGIENSFVSKLDNAFKSIINDRPSATGQLGAFINEVNAQRGVSLTNAQADMLIGYAQWIIDNI